MISEHAAAVLGLLRTAAAAVPPLKVYPLPDGTVPSGLQPPYVRVYIAVERPEAGDMGGASTQAVCRVYLHQIGANDDAARSVADVCADALLDVTPTVAGRVCWPIYHEAQQPPQRQETAGPMLIDQVDVYTYQSAPA